MVAETHDLTARKLTIQIGHAHIYLNQLDAVEEMLKRTSRELPTLGIKSKKSIFNYYAYDFNIYGYLPYPHIKIPIAV